MRRVHRAYQYWVDSANILSLFKIIVLSLVYRPCEVRYFRISKSAQIVIRRFGFGVLGRFKSIFENETGMSSQEEMNIYYRGLCEQLCLVLEIVATAFAQNNLLNRLNYECNRTKINLFLKQRIASGIEPFLVIGNFIEWFCAKDKNLSSLRHIVIIKSNAWRDYLKLFKKDFIWNIYVYPDIKSQIESVFILFKIGLEVIFNAFLLIFLQKTIKTKNIGKPIIAVMHAQGADLNKRADYFWFPNSDIDAERILIYFRYDCFAPSQDSVKLIESYGMQWVNLLPLRLSQFKRLGGALEFYRFPHQIYLKKTLRVFCEFSRLLFYCLGKGGKALLWQWKELVSLFERSAFYESFFAAFNVKLHYSLYEVGIDMFAANVAIERLGGVDLCHHWSNQNVADISLGKPYDIYFSWGPFYREDFFDKDFYELKYLVYTGYPYDNHFQSIKNKAGSLRLKLLNNGAKFIVTFFDQAYSTTWPKVNDNIETVYRALLNKTLQDSSFGLITKPKKNRRFWEGVSDLAALAKQAEATGRCLFLEKDVFTNEAAQEADLVIGFGVYSTPALEAALSGVPALTCDLQNFFSYPFYRGGLNAIVFNDLQMMMEGIEKFRNGQSNGRFGDYSFILKDIDPFRDGRASQRIGKFIHRLLDEFGRGASRQEVMERVCTRYRNEWGTDKVVEFEGDPNKVNK